MKNLKMNVMKRVMACVLMLSVVVGAVVPAVAEAAEAKHIVLTLGNAIMQCDQQDVEIDGAVPVNNNGRVYIPLRAVAEAFGADVDYNDSNRDVTIKNGDIEIIMNTGASLYTVNGEIQTMDMAPYVNEGSRTMVPVRFVSDAFGYEIETTNNEQNIIDKVIISRDVA